jgi:uncharacterized spore protein YtfJ
MNPQDVLSQVRDTLTVKRVFGEPIERNGITIIPVARVAGATGAGDGSAPASAGTAATGSGSGVGYAVRTMPAGVYVNRVILGGQLVVIAIALVIRSLVRAQSARQQENA